MSGPANRWKLGLFVVAGCAASLTGLTWVGMNELKRAYHVAYAFFDEAVTGLEKGSPVKFRGVTIGVVDDIVVADDQKHLQVQMALYVDRLRALRLDVGNGEEDCPLPPNLRAQVVMSWVTSTSFIQVDYYPDPPRGPQMLPFAVPSNTLRTVPSTAKSLEDASREVLRELPSLARSLSELVELLRTELEGARLPELSRELQALLQRVDGTFQQLEQQATVATLTTTLSEARTFVQTLQREVEAAKLGEMAGGVRAASVSVSELGASLGSQLANLRATLDALERLATLLERDPGALLHGRSTTRSPLQEQPPK